MITNTQGLKLVRQVDESYPIIFGSDLFIDIAESLHPDKRYAIVTDSNVRALYAEKLTDALKKKELQSDVFSFPAGEQSKTIHTCIQIADEMSKLKFGRDSVILALGGGVVGDMAGLIASIFNRGIPYIQIPTTLLAQADSSIGGKTAVDSEYGKNLLGTFKQPLAVYIDISTLDTLPEKEIKNGLAETIKHGIIQDAGFFRRLEDIVCNLIAKEHEDLLYIARENCRIKGYVVEQDLHEKGLRRILNYGHTIGHALEKLSNYELTHGESVSMGMMVAARIAISLDAGFSEADLEKQKRLLEAASLPTSIPSDIPNEVIIESTSRDKKEKAGKTRYCLPKSIGQMKDFNGEYATSVDDEIILKALNETR
jgi:3-dehydroquinate synthase